MATGGHSVCLRCGSAIRVDEAGCPRCLLNGAIADSGAREDRLFEQALALEPEARLPFLREACRDDPELLAAVRMLLEGYEEANGHETGSVDSPAPPSAPGGEEPGAVIDHFRLVRRLGEGGMGSVWRAEQTAPVRREVALKVVKLGMDTREVVRRFQRERQTLALLNHPHIARVFEAGATAFGRPYFAMELVEGPPITEYCTTAGLDLAARLGLVLEVCAAVEHAHQKGVIHRDLKPSNILVAGGAAKVIDFGVAKATQGASDTLFTRQQQILGTPAYMSPEQAQSGGVDIDTRTDVYAIGVVLYELLTGTLPIDSSKIASTGVAGMQRLLLEEEPPTPSARITALKSSGRNPTPEIRRGLDPRNDLDWVVMKAIRKDRNERYPSAAALAEDLRRFLAGEPVSAVPPSAVYRMTKFVRRNRGSVLASVAVMLALLSALATSLHQTRRARAALAGEAKARAETTFTLSDMYARSGLTAAERGDVTRATLWFANAAILAEHDPERVQANRIRAAAWRAEARTAVRAFDTGFEHVGELEWNPRHPALIVREEVHSDTRVWDLAVEQPWPPGNELRVKRATWDPTGDRVALALADGALVVLEYPAGRELARVDGASHACLTWSPEGRWISEGTWLWDWRTGERRALPQPMASVRFSRDGRWLLLQWGANAGVCTVDQPDRYLHPPVRSSGQGRSEFLADGARYLCGGEQGGWVIRDSETGALVESHPAGDASPEQGQPIAASRDGRFIASRSTAVVDRQEPGGAKFPDHGGVFHAAAFSGDGSLLASGGYDNRLELWSLPEGGFLGVVGHHHTAVAAVEFSPDGRFVASAEDGLVRVWKARRPTHVRNLPTGEATRAALSPDGRLVAAAGVGNRNGAVRKTRAYEVASGRPAGPEIDPDGLLVAAVFGPEGAWLAMAVSRTPDRGNAAFARSAGAGNIQIWNHATGERLGDPIPMPSEPRGLCLHPTGRWIGVYCAGGQGLEIEVASRGVRVLFDHGRAADADATLNNGRCAYSPDGRLFAAWGLVEFIHLWDRERDRELLAPFEPGSTTFDLAFHGDTVARAIVASRMRIQLSRWPGGETAAPDIPYVNWPFLTRFSADGSLLLTAGGGRSAQVWDWRQGRLVCPALPHDEAVMSGCFVPGTPWVITGGHDGAIRFWDRRTGMPIRPALSHPEWILELQLTPDARTLVANGTFPGIELVDLASALPAPDLDPDGDRLLSEIDADAEVHPGGGLAPLTPESWMARWREFRRRYPDHPGHRLGE